MPLTQFVVLSLQIALLVQTADRPVNGERPLEVCTVLRSLEEYRGKFISIRGRWNGEYLEGDCQTLTNRILINFPTRVSRYPTDSKWLWDEKGIDAANKTYDALFAAGHNVVATFTGRLNAVAAGSNGGGFGHLGEDPAEILLNTITAVVSETGKPVRLPPGKPIGIDR